MSTPTKNYINGGWMTKHPKFDMINLNFKEEFITGLQSLPKDKDGFRHVTLGSQKGDPLKWSIYENTFVPGGRNGGYGGTTDDLPF